MRNRLSNTARPLSVSITCSSGLEVSSPEAVRARVGDGSVQGTEPSGSQRADLVEGPVAMSNISKRPRPRIESLSDLVLGLALSVGTISLISKLPRTPANIVFDIVEFGFSFLILISVWMGYTSIMSVLPLEDRTTVMLNVLMLFFVSIEPYLFYLNAVFDVTDHAILLDAASIAYALDMAGLMAILALFTHQLTLEEKNLIPQNLLAKYKHIRTTRFVSAALFALTILPLFWNWRIESTPLRFYLWFVPLVLPSITRVSEQTSSNQGR